MNKSKGFVKLDREILNEEWFKNPKILQLYIFILLAANHQDGNFNGMEVKRGQLITSLQHLSDSTGQPVRTIRDNLKVLTDSRIIYRTVKERAFTSILLDNYGGPIHSNRTDSRTIHRNNKRNIKKYSEGKTKVSLQNKEKEVWDF